MHTQPKISVIMPSLNVRSYIEECIESAINQTLKDIEIICVDAGSTDGTLEILREYEKRDNRVKVIVSDKKSYGRQMNLGFDAATGEYMAILETDDYIKPNAYEILYCEAKKNNVDFIKADHEIFTGEPDDRHFTYRPLSANPDIYHKVIDPAQNIDVFNANMVTWAGIYKMSFLREHNIRHNETPGAAYQDNGFWFQTFMHAKRIYFLNRAFYMLRRDNPNSSVFNRGKIYSIFEEYAYIEKILRSNKEKEQQFITIFQKKKFDNCSFHYSRVADEFKLEFLQRMASEFKVARERGELDENIFIGSGFSTLCQIMDNTEEYNAYYIYKKTGKITMPELEIKILKAELEAAKQDLADIENSLSFRLGRLITFIPRKIRGAFNCWKENGLLYTMKRVLIHMHILREDYVVAEEVDYEKLRQVAAEKKDVSK